MSYTNVQINNDRGFNVKSIYQLGILCICFCIFIISFAIYNSTDYDSSSGSNYIPTDIIKAKNDNVKFEKEFAQAKLNYLEKQKHPNYTIRENNNKLSDYYDRGGVKTSKFNKLSGREPENVKLSHPTQVLVNKEPKEYRDKEYKKVQKMLRYDDWIDEVPYINQKEVDATPPPILEKEW